MLWNVSLLYMKDHLCLLACFTQLFPLMFYTALSFSKHLSPSVFHTILSSRVPLSRLFQCSRQLSLSVFHKAVSSHVLNSLLLFKTTASISVPFNSRPVFHTAVSSCVQDSCLHPFSIQMSHPTFYKAVSFHVSYSCHLSYYHPDSNSSISLTEGSSINPFRPPSTEAFHLLCLNLGKDLA